MERISFNDLHCLINEDVNTFDFNGNQIEVLQHLPITDKRDLIQITMQKSFKDGLFNNLLLDVYFHLNLVFLYTNLDFTEEERIDEFSLFDKINQSGLMDSILKAMNQEEYDYLYNTLNKEIDNYMLYRNSAASVLQSIIQDLPKNAAIANDIVQNWDLSKFQNLQDMMKVADATGMNNNPINIAQENNVVQFLEEQAKETSKEE